MTSHNPPCATGAAIPLTLSLLLSIPTIQLSLGSGSIAAAADAAEQDFINRSKGGVPDEIDEVTLTGAPMGIAALLKAAGLAPSGSEATRLIEGGGVRVDSSVVSDKALKLEAGTYVVQVGKRKFARVHLSP